MRQIFPWNGRGGRRKIKEEAEDYLLAVHGQRRPGSSYISGSDRIIIMNPMAASRR